MLHPGGEVTGDWRYFWIVDERSSLGGTDMSIEISPVLNSL
jgi:hypothetical protein